MKQIFFTAGSNDDYHDVGILCIPEDVDVNELWEEFIEAFGFRSYKNEHTSAEYDGYLWNEIWDHNYDIQDPP